MTTTPNYTTMSWPIEKSGSLARFENGYALRPLGRARYALSVNGREVGVYAATPASNVTRCELILQG